MITTLTKKRVIRDFDKLEKGFRKKVLKSFPEGISNDIITYLTINGNTVKAIPFETEDTFYLLRIPSAGLTARRKKVSPVKKSFSTDDLEDDNNDSMEQANEEPLDYGSDYHEFDQDEGPEYYN